MVLVRDVYVNAAVLVLASVLSCCLIFSVAALLFLHTGADCSPHLQYLRELAVIQDALWICMLMMLGTAMTAHNGVVDPDIPDAFIIFPTVAGLISGTFFIALLAGLVHQSSECLRHAYVIWLLIANSPGVIVVLACTAAVLHKIFVCCRYCVVFCMQEAHRRHAYHRIKGREFALQ